MKQHFATFLSLGLSLALLLIAAVPIAPTLGQERQRDLTLLSTPDQEGRVWDRKFGAAAQSGRSPDVIVAQAVPGANVRVNNPALDTLGKTQSESNIAVNGPNIVVSFNDRSNGQSASGYSYSTDGGNTFAHSQISGPEGSKSEEDRTVEFGVDGELYHVSVAVTSEERRFLSVAKSTDSGVSFGRPVFASRGPFVFHFRSGVTVDKSGNSPYRGNVYVSWTQSIPTGGKAIAFARSTDRGDTFDPPVILSSLSQTSSEGAMPAVGADGTVYVAYFDDSRFGTEGMWIVKSTDGRVTFAPPSRAVSFTPIGLLTGGGGSVLVWSWPNLAVDKNGYVHVVYNGLTRTDGPDRSDIYHVRSTDGGDTFGPPLKLNDDQTTTSQASPSIAAADDGTIGVKWWDRRNDPIHDSLTDVYMCTSTNGGQSFSKNFRITDHNWVFGPIEFSPGFAYHGNHDGITADGASFFLSWSDERNGNPDVYFAEIPVRRDPDAPDFNISGIKLYDTIMAGGAVAFDFVTSANSSFSGALTLSASPQIAGMSYAFAKSVISPGQPATMIVSTAPSIAPGSYLLTVEAEGSGLARKTNILLTVYDSDRVTGRTVNATDTRGYTTARALAVDQNGAIHLVFRDDSESVGSGESILYKRSGDGGLTFSSAVKLSDIGQCLVPISPCLSMTPQFYDTPSLAINPAGNLFVVWKSFETSAGQAKVFFSKSAGDANFTSPVAISGLDHVFVHSPQIAVHRNRNVIVTYYNNRIYAVSSTDGGATFENPIQISNTFESGSGTTGAPVAFNSRGVAYLVHSPGGRINVLAAPDGQNFGAPVEVSAPLPTSANPQIAIDGNDTIFITFSQVITSGSTSRRDVFLVKSTDGVSFGPPVNVSKGSGGTQSSYVIATGQGKVTVVWGNGGSEADIFLSQSNDGGLTFSSPINVSANPGGSFSPCGAADSRGNVYIGWTDDSMGNNDFLIASAPDFGLSFNPAILTVSRGQNFEIPISISRTTGFSDNITVTPPDTSGTKIKIKPRSVITSNDSATFKFKIKGGARRGIFDLLFEGRDGSGRTRTATIRLAIE